MTLRVGLLGAVNNSAYGLAAGLAAAGADVRFLRTRHSTLPIDQPVWQDASFTMALEDFSRSGAWSWDRWQAFEADVGWEPPGWLADVAGADGRYVPRAEGVALRTVLAVQGRRRPDWAAVQELLVDRDLLVVSGRTPALLAAGSGRPFVVWPHGSDARAAARDFPPAVRGLRRRAAAEAEAALLRRAYAASTGLATHDPLLVTADRDRCRRLESLATVRFLGWPVTTSPRRSPVERRRALGDLLGRLGADDVRADLVALVASRIDYALKGHDRLIAAVEEVGDVGLHYLVVGWGADLPRAREALRRAGLEDRVTLVPRVMSKPVVRELYASVDLSVDQFVYGTYGTAALESMAVGTPVLMAVDEAAFAARGWEPPPVLAARTASEIARVLRAVASGHVDLEDAGRRAQTWVGRRHGTAAVRAQLHALAVESGLGRGGVS